MFVTMFPIFFRLILIVLSIFILSGCNLTSQKMKSEELATNQVNKLSRHLPVQDGAYTFVLAQRAENTINLVFVYDEKNNEILPPSRFSELYQRMMCADPSVRMLINNGVIYKVTVNSLQSTPLGQTHIDNQTCGAVIT